MLKRLDPKIRPQAFRVHLELDPSRKDFRGLVEIDVRLGKATSILELHAQDLVFEEVVLVDGTKRIAAVAMGKDSRGMSWFDFGRALGPGDITISFSYQANYASGLEGAYRSRIGRRWAIFTQFEAIGARRVIPCFDEPGFKAPFEITITSPTWAKVVSNTMLVETSETGKFSENRFAPTVLLPAYLIVFAVGDFDIVEYAPIAAASMPRAPIPLRGISQKGRGDELTYVLSISARLLIEIENYFGIAYPFDKLDIIAVPDFAAGGMENAGAITYDEGYVLLDEDETDLDRKRDMLTLHAHELVHQWFGNLVSPQWWDDLWLNESFATLLESKFSNLVEPRWHFSTDVLLYSHGAMALDLLPSVRRVHEPVISEDGISTAFDSITYEKGSVVLAMVENVLGEDGFRKFISDLLKARKFGTYDTASFVAELRSVPKGAEAADLLLSLIDHTGLPLVKEGVEAFPHDAVPRYQRTKLTEAQWLQHCKEAMGLPLPQALAIAIGFDISFYAREISPVTYFSGIRELAKHSMWEVAGLALENLQFIILELPDDQNVKEFAAGVFGPLFVVATSTIDMVVQWQMEKQEADLAEFFALTRSDDKIFQHLMSDGLTLLKADDPFETPYPETRLPAALLAAGQSQEEWVLPRLLKLLGKADDVHQRGHLIGALCACPGPKVDAVLEDMLQGDALLTHELTELLDCRARFPEFRTALWEMISHNADLLLKRLDGDSEVALIQVADAFADLKFVDALQMTIVPLLGRLRGGVPQLALTQDKIRLNAALIAHLRHQATP